MKLTHSYHGQKTLSHELGSELANERGGMSESSKLCGANERTDERVAQ